MALIDRYLRDFATDHVAQNLGKEKLSGTFHRLYKANPELFRRDPKYVDHEPRVKGVVAAHEIACYLDELAHPDEYERDDHGQGEVLMRAPSTETVLSRLGELEIGSGDAIELGYMAFSGDPKVYADTEFASFMDGFVTYFETATATTT